MSDKPIGRPPLYRDEDAPLFEAKVDQYFDMKRAAEGLESIPTIAELALHLGFNHRDAVADYEKRPAFSRIVTRARTMIEVDRNRRLVAKDFYTPGLPMDLANHHGYVTGKEERFGKDGGAIQTVNTIRWETVPKPQRADAE